MRVLVDTNVLLWATGQTAKLSSTSRRLIEDENHEIWISTISLAEIHIKVAIEKLKLPQAFDKRLREIEYSYLQFRAEHARWLSELPLHHRDPFDRMIIAQAIEEGMSILTSDEKFERYPVHVIRN